MEVVKGTKFQNGRVESSTNFNMHVCSKCKGALYFSDEKNNV